MKNKVLLILSLTLALGANLYVRTFSVYFPQLKAHARNVVNGMIEQAAVKEIHQKFPQFYALAKDKIVRSRIAEYKKQNKAEIKKQVNEIYRKLKDKYQDESGQTYMMELDCWHWTRYVENVLNLGHPGDQRIYGNEWDMMMLAPTGWCILWDNFLYYLSAFLYRIFSLFMKVPLRTFLFYLPLGFISVFILVLYMISYRYGGYIGATVTSIYVGLISIFIPRSCAGWFDKDILSLLFPLLIIWSYLSAFEARSVRAKFLWISLSSFFVGLFAWAWTMWWYIFYIIILYELLSLAYFSVEHFYLKRNRVNVIKKHAYSLISFILLSLSWAMILAGFEPVKNLYEMSIFAVTKLNKPLIASVWPNVYSTVGETRKGSYFELARSIGGTKMVPILLVSMIVQLVRALSNKRYAGVRRESMIIFTIWLVSMIFASTRGVRFILYVAIPLGIPLGWMINDLYKHFLKKKNRFGLSLLLTGTVLLCASSIDTGCKVASAATFPLIDDTWYKVLNVINEKTPPETIVNSWWDYGDWFKVIAKRRVIFDGQSQGNPRAYWMAKAILSDDENEAISILRMLNNGGNKAFDIIDEYIKNPLQSVLLLESIIGTPAERAKATLLKFLPPLAVENMLKILYYTPPKAIFIVEDSMLGKMAAISFLGEWDFSKVYIAQNFDKQEKGQIIDHLKNLGREEREIQRFYQEVFLISTKNLDDWLSHRLVFYSEMMDGNEKDGTIHFPNGFAYNSKESTVQVGSGQIPRSMFIASEDGITENPLPNSNVIYSIFIFKAEKGYKAILLDRELAGSMFVRLYFLKGKGLKHFSSFIDVEEGDRYIRCYNINW